MGVDFGAYSQVVTKPVPQKYRATIKPPNKTMSRQEMVEHFSAPGASKDDIRGLVALARMMTGIGIDQQSGQDVYASEVTIPYEEEFGQYLREHCPDYIGVQWRTNTTYHKSPDTNMVECGRSCGGYAEFIDCLTKFNGGRPLTYMPPSTDSAPEYGIVSADKMLLCLQELRKHRKHFVPDDWVYSARDADSAFDETPQLHNSTWFF